jgi:hypothetical protein
MIVQNVVVLVRIEHNVLLHMIRPRAAIIAITLFVKVNLVKVVPILAIIVNIVKVLLAVTNAKKVMVILKNVKIMNHNVLKNVI